MRELEERKEVRLDIEIPLDLGVAREHSKPVRPNSYRQIDFNCMEDVLPRSGDGLLKSRSRFKYGCKSLKVSTGIIAVEFASSISFLQPSEHLTPRNIPEALTGYLICNLTSFFLHKPRYAFVLVAPFILYRVMTAPPKKDRNMR